MKAKKHPAGVTLIELVIVVGIAAALLFGFAMLVGKNVTFFKRTRVRQETMSTTRNCLDRIDQVVRIGKARSLIISTPPATPPATDSVPNSRIDFNLQTALPSGATAYAIFLMNGEVYTQEYIPSPPAAVNGAQPPRAVASHVTGLMFTGNSMDPGLISVSLRVDIPYDDTHMPGHVSTLIVPNRILHMVETP